MDVGSDHPGKGALIPILTVDPGLDRISSSFHESMGVWDKGNAIEIFHGVSWRGVCYHRRGRWIIQWINPDFNRTAVSKTLIQEETMVKISIFYPEKSGMKFDMDYYLKTHMPMAIGFLSKHPGFKGVSVEKGLDGSIPGMETTFAVSCHFLFGSVEDFVAAFSPHAESLQGDIPNYTDVQPAIQISEVVLAIPQAG